MKRFGQFLFSSVLLVTSGFTAAQAETVNCTVITSLPYSITAQGVYCLTGHLNTSISSGNAITINANNVVLDLNGFKIGGLGAGPGTTAIGIWASQRQNITIKNGTVRGFFIGIDLSDYSPFTTSQGHVVEDIRADLNNNGGIYVAGRGVTIRNNQVVSTGGGSTDDGACGIAAFGPGAQVLDNMVTDVAAQTNGVAWGIALSTAPGSVVARNRVSNLTGPVFGPYGDMINTFGIDVLVSSSVIVRDNSLSSVWTGVVIVGSTGIAVSDNTMTGTRYGVKYGPGSDGPYMNNLVWGTSTYADYSGGTPYTE